MWSIVSFLFKIRRKRQLGPARRRNRQQDRALPVLLASNRLDDFGRLDAILRASQWALFGASSWAELKAYCGGATNAIVLLDESFDGSNWHSGLLQLPNRSAIILLSEVSDPYLWSEFVRSGGFQVLPRPIDAEELIGVLAFARRHLDGPWPGISPAVSAPRR